MLRSGQCSVQSVAASSFRRGGLAIARSSATSLAASDEDNSRQRQPQHPCYGRGATGHLGGLSNGGRCFSSVSIERRENTGRGRGGRLASGAVLPYSVLAYSSSMFSQGLVSSSNCLRNLTSCSGDSAAPKPSAGTPPAGAGAPPASAPSAGTPPEPPATGGAVGAGNIGEAAVDGSVASSVVDAAQQVEPVTNHLWPEWYMLPVEVAMKAIDGLVTTTGMPYWASIAAVTLGIRTLLLPLGIDAIRNSKRMAIVQPELDLLKKSMEEDTDTPRMKKTMRFRREMSALLRTNKCSFSRSMMFPVFQLPVFLTFFAALRNMASYYPGYSTGGILWFQNLGAPDPNVILPTVTALTFLYVMETGAEGKTGNLTPPMRVAMRGLPLFMVPLTMFTPAGVFVYWSVSNSFSLVQTAVLKRPSVMKWLEIPDVPLPPPPGSDGSEIRWLDVLAAPNPFKAYKKRMEQQERYRTPIGNIRRDVVMRKGAPLPPPPPVILDNKITVEEGGKAVTVATAEGDVKLYTAKPIAKPAETGTARWGGSIKSKRWSTKKRKSKHIS